MTWRSLLTHFLAFAAGGGVFFVALGVYLFFKARPWRPRSPSPRPWYPPRDPEP